MAQRLRTDWVLFGTIVVMVGFGLVMIYSASSVVAQMNPRIKSSFYFAAHQLVWAALSFGALMYFKRRDYRALQSPGWAFGSLGVVLFLQILVFFFDPKTHRWFRLEGIGTLQPSEFAKPALVIFFAYFVTEKQDAINSKRTMIAASLALAVIAAAVGFGDLGTALVLIIPAAIVFYVAGLERKFVAIALLTGLAFSVVFVASKPYRMARIIGFFDPQYKLISMIDRQERIKKYVSESVTTRDAGYQVRQSKIAVGSGGFIGLGLMQGKQKILYLPEAHTDFIYAVVGEELGLFGCAAVLGGFLVILWRGLQLYWVAPDDFGRYLALGVTCSIVIQALINISVVLGMGPTKGIPLPMISAGGSSLMSTLMCLGMLLSVSERSG
ncbi:MAG TPA: putative peptidoglycan glycosyltransferase FtsW [Bryobacteraceae bacterium]|jgi:cell division protein FtsW|nr:putative peptidoglycan glycosyltransferase FtsW [Bryobacteraceae bacterium]